MSSSCETCRKSRQYKAWKYTNVVHVTGMATCHTLMPLSPSPSLLFTFFFKFPPFSPLAFSPPDVHIYTSRTLEHLRRRPRSKRGADTSLFYTCPSPANRTIEHALRRARSSSSPAGSARHFFFLFADVFALTATLPTDVNAHQDDATDALSRTSTRTSKGRRE